MNITIEIANETVMAVTQICNQTLIDGVISSIRTELIGGALRKAYLILGVAGATAFVTFCAGWFLAGWYMKKKEANIK